MKKILEHKKAFMISSLVAVLILLIIYFFMTIQIREIESKRELETTNSYINFQYKLNNYLVTKTSLLQGFKAFIEIYDNGDDQVIYTYLDHLLKEGLSDIKNVGVIKNTTIAWNYPQEGNEASIGVNLLEIKEQSELVLYVKNNLVTVFQGPVDLVQGGTGYIIRDPIVTDGTYWGMLSIVLKGERFISILDGFSDETGLDVLIRDANSDNSVIYGSESILEDYTITFVSEEFYGKWEVFLRLRDVNNRSTYLMLLLSLSMLIGLSLLLLRILYRYILTNEAITQKNLVLHEQVTRDNLTGVYTRSYFYNIIFKEVERSIRYSYDLVFIFCDIDHFKNVNDSYGHDMGDRVLSAVARSLTLIIRESDTITRWGGEEFLIVLPHTTMKDGLKVAEKMRASLESTLHPRVGKITGSFGVSRLLDNEYIGSCINRADHAMYLAKTHGRNIVIASKSSIESEDVSLKISWQETFKSGNEVIDSEHETLLIELTRLAEQSYFNEKRDMISDNIPILVEQIVNHFRHEEGILKVLEWKKLEQHIVIHKVLLKEIEDMQIALNSMDVEPYRVLQEMTKLIENHLNHDDLEYIQFMQSVKE